MLDTYIKNRGSTKTIIHENNRNKVNVIKWDADYDGNEANISLDLNNNNKAEHYDIKLDNDDLANILNVNSVKTPIHKRLKNDFKKAKIQRDPNVYNIYIDDFKAPDLRPKSISLNNLITKYRPTVSLDPVDSLDSLDSLDPVDSLDSLDSLDPVDSLDSLDEPMLNELLQIAAPNNNHFSSPLTDEELIIPLTIDKDSNTFGKHKTHRVYKRHINSAAKGLKKNNSKRKNKYKGKSKGKTHRKKYRIGDKLKSLLHI